MTGVLGAVQGTWEHLLSVALRFDDHFFGNPIDEMLQVTLAAPSGRWLFPISSPSGAGIYRQYDGTYRYADLNDGHYPLVYTSPSGNWVSWDPPLTVQLPIGGSDKLIVRQMWPAPQSTVPAGTTAIRGKLVGANVGGVQLEICASGGPFDGHYNFSDEFGEVFYPILTAVTPQTNGQFLLTARVAGGARTVDSTDVIDGSTITHTVGTDFLVNPGRASRVKFNVT